MTHAFYHADELLCTDGRNMKVRENHMSAEGAEGCIHDITNENYENRSLCYSSLVFQQSLKANQATLGACRKIPPDGKAVYEHTH